MAAFWTICGLSSFSKTALQAGKNKNKLNDPPSHNHSLEQVISKVLMGEVQFLIRIQMHSGKSQSPVLMAFDWDDIVLVQPHTPIDSS
jgi:hypothetical protein